jgi:hypothetical protein
LPVGLKYSTFNFLLIILSVFFTSQFPWVGSDFFALTK